MRFLSLLTLLPFLVLALFSLHSNGLPLQERQSTFVGYLVSYFIGDNPKIFQRLSNGNTALEFTALNGGNPILTPSASGGTGGKFAYNQFHQSTIFLNLCNLESISASRSRPNLTLLLELIFVSPFNQG